MNNTWQIKIKDNLQIVVPADISNQTTYVLLEQEDWYEPEIEFIRILSEPDFTALDMNTGCGIYALTLANEMDGRGKVTALNPDEHFQQSVEANKLQGLISTEQGEGGFDFIRLGDTEPDRDLLSQGDPMIMFPATENNIRFFQDQGLKLYKHIPALNILAPYTEDYTPSILFACSQERAARLEQDELLVFQPEQEVPAHLKWQDVMHAWPFARGQMQRWQGEAVDTEYQTALNTFLSSMDKDHDLSARYSLLKQSLNLFNALQDEHIANTLALIRINSDLGYREQAATLANQFLQGIGKTLTLKMDRPFVSPSSAFDERSEKEDLGKWLSAAIMYALETQRAYTSYHNPQEHIPVLSQANKLTDSPLEIQRRLALCAMRKGTKVNIQPSSRLLTYEHLNQEGKEKKGTG